MPTPFSKISKAVTPHIPGHTLYQMMRSSHDFEDVKGALNDRTVWSIELFRSCFAIHLLNGSYFPMLSTLSFLFLAETIHIHYGRLSSAELKERVEAMGCATFVALFVVLDTGFIVVRVATLVALSGTPGLAAGLVFISMLPSVIPALLTYVAMFVGQRERASGEGDELESGTVLNKTQN